MCVRKVAPIYNKSIANITAGVNIKLSRNIHVPNLYGITIGKLTYDKRRRRYSLGLFFNGLSRKAAIAIEADGTIRAERKDDTAGQYILKRQFLQKGGIIAETAGNETARKAGIIIPEYT